MNKPIQEIASIANILPIEAVCKEYLKLGEREGVFR